MDPRDTTDIDGPRGPDIGTLIAYTVVGIVVTAAVVLGVVGFGLAVHEEDAKTTVSSAPVDLSAVQSKLDALNDTLVNTSSVTAEHAVRLQDQETRITSLNGTVADLQTTAATHTGQIVALDVNQGILQEAMTDVQTTVGLYGARITALEAAPATSYNIVQFNNGDSLTISSSTSVTVVYTYDAEPQGSIFLNSGTSNGQKKTIVLATPAFIIIRTAHASFILDSTEPEGTHAVDLIRINNRWVSAGTSSPIWIVTGEFSGALPPIQFSQFHGEYGYAAGISGDGRTIVAGDPTAANEVVWVSFPTSSTTIGNGFLPINANLDHGAGLDVSTDGQRAFVGATAANTGNGGVGIYRFNGATAWIQEENSLVCTGTVSGTQGFGGDIAANGVGSVVIAATTDATGNPQGMCILHRDGTTWSQANGGIVPVPAGYSHSTGTQAAVAIDESGHRAVSVVRQSGDLSLLTYTLDDNGDLVGSIAATALSLSSSGAQTDSVSISANGKIVVVGCNTCNSTGEVLIMSWDDTTDTWSTDRQVIQAPNGTDFGTRVTISGDGRALYVASTTVNGGGGGYWKLYRRLSGEFVFVDTTPAQAIEDITCGYDIKVSSDGRTLAIGCSTGTVGFVYTFV